MHRVILLILTGLLAAACGALPSLPTSNDATRIPTVLPLPTRTPTESFVIPTITLNGGGPTATPTPQPITVNGCEIPGGLESYTVQRGDRLSQIASDFDVTLDALIELNCIDNPNSIFVGQQLYIPAPPSPADTTTGAALGCEPGVQGREAIVAWEQGDCLGVLPFVSYEGGFLTLPAGAVVTVRYIAPPGDAVAGEFVLLPAEGAQISLGADTTPENGLNIRWNVPATAGSGRLAGVAVREGGQETLTGAIPVQWGNS